ncbi:hypothetical protein FACS189499_02310 [Clostridia bacterium]|nr:hypothetical protein FACS189499_02310 [Clostridia bacterium]
MNISAIKPFFSALRDVFFYITEISGEAFRHAARNFVEFFLLVLKFFWDNSVNLREKIHVKLKIFATAAATPFVKLSLDFTNMVRTVRAAGIEGGDVAARKAFAPYVKSFVFGRRGLLVTAVNYALPVVCAVFLYNLVDYTLNSTNYVVRLSVGGEFLGYIENEQVWDEAEMTVKQRLTALGSGRRIKSEPQFAVERVALKDTLTAYGIADIILAKSNIKVEKAYGISINDKLYCAVQDNRGIKRTLENILSDYQTGNPEDEVSFVWEINCDQPGLYTTESIIDPKEVIALFAGKKQEAEYYTVEYGDSHSLIGDKLNLKMSELEDLNPGFAMKPLEVGDQIKYSREVPYLDVSVRRTLIYSEEIPYETEFAEDSNRFEGTQAVGRKGEPGMREVVVKVTEVNGIEIKRDAPMRVETLKDPVKELVYQGVKPTPLGTFSKETASYGHFIWPVKKSDGGYISELAYWDGGYAGHKGVDFAAPYGTPIYAGGGGTVVLARSGTGFGLHVIIQHENGLRTLYAHASELYVRAGQTVAQGECIGLVGTTGNVTGPHCHFEVRQGNTFLNPINYVDR